MQLGERIKFFRKESGLTQKELAEKIGKGMSTVQKYELGLVEPPIDALSHIGYVLNIPTSALLADDYIERYSTLGYLSKEVREDMIHYAKTPEEWEHVIKIQPKDIQKQLAGGDYEEVLYSLLTTTFRRLNLTGQQKAVENVQILEMVPEYQKAPSEALESPKRGKTGKDTSKE